MTEASETSPARPALRVCFLGQARVRAGKGRDEPLPGLPAAFLAYICLADRPVSREHMAELFWPESDRSRGLQSVRQTLVRLRGQLGREVVEGGGTLTVVRDGLEVDVDAFREALDRGDTGEALDLWPGPFLAGFRRPGAWELENWLERERSRLERRLVVALEARIRDLTTGGAAGGAVDLARRARALFPLEEGLAVLEVEALAGAGRVAEAEGALAALDPELDQDLRDRAEDAVRRLRADVQHTGPHPSPAGPPPSREAPPPVRQPAGRSAAEDPPPPPRRPLLWIAIVAVSVILGAIAVRGAFPEGEARTRALAESYSDLALLYCSESVSEDGSPQIFRMALDGLDKHRITREPGCDVRGLPDGSILAAHPSGPRIAVYQYRPNPDNPLAEWLRTHVTLPQGLEQVWIGPRAVDADGGVWFSARDSLDQWDLYRLLPGADSVVRLTNDEAPESAASLDPRDPSGPIVFTRYNASSTDHVSMIASGGDLFAMPREGGEIRRLTAKPLVERNVFVRGDTVLFERGWGDGEQDGNIDIFLLHLESGREERLTENDWNDYGTNWSPDGHYLCLQSERYGHLESDVLVMDLRTRETWTVAGQPGRQNNCLWTPDSRGVLFAGDMAGDEDLYLVPRRGGTPLALTHGGGRDASHGVYLLFPGSGGPR